MTIYDGSRYTNIPVSTQFGSEVFIGPRNDFLQLQANAGDNMIVVQNDEGFFRGQRFTIFDGANTESFQVDYADGPIQEQMWNSVSQSYVIMNHYHVYLFNGAKLMHPHSQGTVVQFQKTNYRPSMLSAINFRVGVIDTDSRDDSVVWRLNDRLDLYAYQFYGDAQLWWAILDANQQYTSELDIKIGDIVIIPRYEKVRQYLRGGS